jgi:hypothetical protein
MSVPSITTIKIYKGTDFEKKVSIGVTTLNASNHTATAKIRKHESAETSYNFNTYIDESDNSVVISMASTITDDLTLGRNYFDIIIRNNTTNKTMKLVEGSIIVNQTVSI